MTKYGWWSIKIELDFEPVLWDSLDKDTQEYIKNCISLGYADGQLTVETCE